MVTVTLGVTLTLLGLKVIGSDDDLPQIGNDENVAYIFQDNTNCSDKESNIIGSGERGI